MSLLAALFTIFVPAFLAAPGDAQRIGYFGEDYEGNLCGQLAFDGDGRMGRDLRLRPFAYWLNASSIVCVRTCPRLSDELACEYPLEALTTGAKRAALGARCFAQQRTRTAFPACLPHAPAAALPVDRWLQGHALDQLAADTLHASGVLLGCWVAAGLAGLISLGGLLFLPRLTVLIVMVGALTTALAAAAMLLPHGVRSLAAARAPLERNEATYWREEIPGLAPVTAPAARGKADRPSDASQKEYEGYEEEYEEEAGMEPELPKTFLAAGQRCADLFGGRVGAGGASLSTAREAAHYIYSLLKWTIAGGVALVGWLCLTSDQAEPLMSPIWPTAIILEGSMALVSAALATHEAALEALLQCYAEEMEAAERLALSAPPPSRAGPKSARNTPLGSTPTPTAERAAAAASLFGSAQDAAAGGGYGSMTSGAPYLGVGTALDPRFG